MYKISTLWKGEKVWKWYLCEKYFDIDKDEFIMENVRCDSEGHGRVRLTGFDKKDRQIRIEDVGSLRTKACQALIKEAAALEPELEWNKLLAQKHVFHVV